MSIENNIKRIADALEELVRTVQQTVNPVIKVEPVTQPAPAPIPPVTSEVVPPVPPTPPAPVAPVSQNEPVTNVPFTDINGLVQYVMQKYQALGAEKGSQIQGVLTGLGYANINDVKPEHFAQFHSQIEAIK